MCELGGGVEVLESLVLVGPHDVGDGVVCCLLVKQAAQDVVSDLLVLLVARVGHFLHSQENLGEAAHDGGQERPVLVAVCAVQGAAHCDEHFLVEDLSDEVEGPHVVGGGSGLLWSRSALLAYSLRLEEPGDQVVKLAVVIVEHVGRLALERLSHMGEEGVEARVEEVGDEGLELLAGALIKGHGRPQVLGVHVLFPGTPRGLEALGAVHLPLAGGGIEQNILA